MQLIYQALSPNFENVLSGSLATCFFILEGDRSYFIFECLTTQILYLKDIVSFILLVLFVIATAKTTARIAGKLQQRAQRIAGNVHLGDRSYFILEYSTTQVLHLKHIVSFHISI